jgi:hypothetical protein
VLGARPADVEVPAKHAHAASASTKAHPSAQRSAKVKATEIAAPPGEAEAPTEARAKDEAPAPSREADE